MFYEVLRVILIIYFRVFHSLEITGKEHIPADGPVILCANHSSYFDSMLVGLSTKRKVRFIIYDRFYYQWFFGPFIRALKAIPVAENRLNTGAMKKALETLRSGELIGIFPEGRLTRTGLPGPAEPGAALLAALSGALLVPITINGAFSVYPKGRKLPKPSGKITVEVHPSVKVDSARRREKGYLKSVIDKVMEIIGSSLIFPKP